MDFIKDFTITKEADSQVKIEGEIPFAELEKHRTNAVKHIGKDMKLDGFRKGNIPEKVLIDKVGEMAVITEMAERALAVVYPKAIVEHSIDAIGHPQINITKIAKGNPLGFTAIVAIVPEITLPDYEKIAKGVNKNKESIEVTDEEVEKQVEDILRQKVAYERMQAKVKSKVKSEKSKDELEKATELPTPETVEKIGSATLSDASESVAEKLPELTDEYVKTVGTHGQFESVADFKAKIKEHITVEKERDVNMRHRAKITDEIIEKSGITLPKVLIDSEISQMFGQMNEDLSRANLKMDDYLTYIKKTEEELKKE